MTKICAKCKTEKNVTDFYKSANGYRYYCKKCDNEINKLSYHKNRDKNLKRDRQYRNNNKEKIAKRKAIQYVRSIKPKYNEKKEHLRAIRNKRYSIRIKQDIKFKITKNCRGRIQIAFKKGLSCKSCKTSDLLGCDLLFLKNYLESLFTDGMSWDNYGQKGWHIDHIRPCSSFDLTDPEEQKKCFHYTNLQPLWWYDNLKKGNKIL